MSQQTQRAFIAAVLVAAALATIYVTLAGTQNRGLLSVPNSTVSPTPTQTAQQIVMPTPRPAETATPTRTPQPTVTPTPTSESPADSTVDEASAAPEVEAAELIEREEGAEPTDVTENEPGAETEAPELVVTVAPESEEASYPAAGEAGRQWPTFPVTDEDGHFWLGRPFGPGEVQTAEAFYPYASTGRGRYLLHRGADFPAEAGTPVLNVGDGIVVYAGDDSVIRFGPFLDFYGNLIIVELDQQYRERKVFVLYGHLDAIEVEIGQEVSEGERIGAVGMSGIAIGPHLHLEVRYGANTYDDTRNPELWLRPLPGAGVLIGRLLSADGHTLSDLPLNLYRQDQPERLWMVIHTYIDADGIHPAEPWAENFVLPDIPVGEYVLETRVEGRLLREPFTIRDGEAAFLDLRASRE